VPFFEKWLKRTTASSWAGWNYEDDLKRVKIPALMIIGWWEGDGIGTKRNWRIMADLGRTNQWLIDGPWPHAFNSGTSFGGVDYGPTAVLELDSVYLRWFDTWLKHKKVGLEKVPKVRVFLTGANEWRTLHGWPDRRSTERRLFLTVGKAKSDAKAIGGLVSTPVAGQEPSAYTFDPSKGTAPINSGAIDIASASTAVPFGDGGVDDLTFRTEPLTSPVDMGGPISIDLWFSSSARDADFFASVVDVDEKGVARMVGIPGKMRVSYLSGWNSPKPIVPGKIYKATLEHWDSAHRFLKGHRIGLLISSGMFPEYARNAGTGEPISTATRTVVGRETIYHDAKHPSCLRFMVIPAK
jgi:putative CocE/NonD family hydrolase